MDPDLPPPKKKNKNAKEKIEFTHFIQFPVENAEFLESFSLMCQDFLLSPEIIFNKKHLKLLFQNPLKMHMTICVLYLPSEKEITKVQEILQNISENFKSITNGQLSFNFEKFDLIGSSKKAKVIHAKMIEDENFEKASNLINYIIQSFIDQGIIQNEHLGLYNIDYDQLQGKYQTLKHITLMNVSFLNRSLQKGGRKGKRPKYFPFFDAESSGIMKALSSKVLPSFPFTKIYFTKMKGGQDGRYELVNSYDL